VRACRHIAWFLDVRLVVWSLGGSAGVQVTGSSPEGSSLGSSNLTGYVQILYLADQSH